MSSADNQEGEPGGVARRRDDADVDFGSASDVVRSLRLERELRRLAPGLNRYDSRKTDSSIQWNTNKLLEGTASRRATAFGEANETTDGCSSDDSENEEAAGPPPPSRLIVEHGPLIDMIRERTRCPHCRTTGTMTLSFETVCVASIPKLVCANPECDSDTVTASIAETGLREEGETLHTRIKDFETNIRYVLAFIASGDGGKEAERLLGLLDLPNLTTMSSRSFAMVEKVLSVHVIAVGKQAIHENVLEEVRLSTLGNGEFNYGAWKEVVDDFPPTGNELMALPDGCCRPWVDVSMDMGWNKRSSGRQYDSNSGHACMVGTRTRKPIALCMKSKFCAKCTWSTSRGKEPKEHDCRVNHVGSSGSMEASALVDMLESLHDKYCIDTTSAIIDDDSHMRSAARWSNEAYTKHHKLDIAKPIIGAAHDKKKPLHLRPIYRTDGKLRYPVNEPRFPADPAHRKKTLRNRLYLLMNSGAKGNCGMLEGDIIRLCRSFIYCVKQLPGLPRGDWCNRGKAILELAMTCVVTTVSGRKRLQKNVQDRQKSIAARNEMHTSTRF